MAIRLLIDGQAVQLAPKQQIRLKLKSGLLNFEVIEPTVSYPFDLPYTDANRRAFGHIDQVASTRKFAQEYEAQLEVDGLLLNTGKFVLEKVIPYDRFSGYFKADAGTISSRKEESILHFLDEVLSFNHYTDAYSAQYDALDSDFVFPKLNYRTESSLFHNYPFAVTANAFNRLCLCVKLKYVLTKVLEGLDFEPVYLVDDYLFNQAIFIGKRFLSSTPAGAFTLAVRDYVPDMTVSAFLRSIKAMFGIALSFNSRTGKCKIGYLKDILSATNALDWTDRAVPRPEIEEPESQGSGTFSFGYAAEANEEQLTPVVTAQDLPDAFENLDKVCLVLRENQYYKASTYNTPSETSSYGWQVAYPALLNQEVEGIGKAVSCDFVPLPNSFQFIYKYTEAKIVDNGNGKVRITGLGRNFPEQPLIRITNVRSLGNEWQATTNRQANFIDLPFLDYEQDENNVEFEWQFGDNNELLPDVQLELQQQPLVSLWHGVHNYRYASAAGYSLTASFQLSPTALRWEQNGGLIADQFSDFIELLQNGKQVTHQVWLKLVEVLNFDSFRKVRIDGSEFVVGEVELNKMFQVTNSYVECMKI
ncbi:MAG: hypothetical protein ACPGJS_00680 [Flammeovirgaceae bacterium]